MQVSTDLAVTIFQARDPSVLTLPSAWVLGARPPSMYFSSSASPLWNLRGFLRDRAQAGRCCLGLWGCYDFVHGRSWLGERWSCRWGESGQGEGGMATQPDVCGPDAPRFVESLPCLFSPLGTSPRLCQASL